MCGVWRWGVVSCVLQCLHDVVCEVGVPCTVVCRFLVQHGPIIVSCVAVVVRRCALYHVCVLSVRAIVIQLLHILHDSITAFLAELLKSTY